MPPRRREVPLANHVVEREMRELHTRLEIMEVTQRRTPDIGDISEVESEHVEVEEVVGEDVVEERLLKLVSRLGDKDNIEVPMYEGNLNVEEIFD
jgi:hypothetical protein